MIELLNILVLTSCLVVLLGLTRTGLTRKVEPSRMVSPKIRLLRNHAAKEDGS